MPSFAGPYVHPVQLNPLLKNSLFELITFTGIIERPLLSQAIGSGVVWP